MSDGDIVRKITISATGQDIDSTRSSTEQLSTALSQLTAANQKNTDSLRDAITSHESYSDTVLKVATAAAVLTGAGYALNSMFSTLSDVQSKYVETLEKAWAAETSLMTSALPDWLRAYTTSWSRTNELLAEYIDLANKAAALGVSTDFYQKETGGIVAMKGSVDDLVKSLGVLKTATADQLGGSTGMNRLDQLTTGNTDPRNDNGTLKANTGNFQGNTGVDALRSATTVEEQYKAVVSLISQAMDSGQRLAALDVAKTFLGPEVASNLAKDWEYLNKMQTAADKMSYANLVPDDDVSRALDLSNRLQAAEDIIEKKWWPAQRDGLNPLVMVFKGLWVDIVEIIASGFGWAEKMVSSLLSIPTTLWNSVKDLYAIITTGFPQQLGPATPDHIATPMEAATNRLTIGLKNPNTVAQAGLQSQSIDNVFDFSKNPKADPTKQASAYDTATASLQKYIETTNAASTAVDAGAGEQEKLKAIAQLTAAGMKDGLTEAAAAAKAQLDGMATAAGVAADKLAKAKIESQIKFATNTALLSPEDVQIATQLKTIYPDIATALGSVQAQAIRANNILSDLNSTGRTVAEGIGTDIVTQLRQGASAWDAFRTAGVNALGKIEDKLIQMAIDKVWQSALGGSSSSILGLFGATSATMSGTGLGAGTGGLSFPMFASGTDNAPGGWSIVGEKGPELVNLNPGSKVLPNGQTPQMGSHSTTIQYNIDASGADSGTVQRIQQVLATHGTAIVKQAKAMQSAQNYQSTGVR